MDCHTILQRLDVGIQRIIYSQERSLDSKLELALLERKLKTYRLAKDLTDSFEISIEVYKKERITELLNFLEVEVQKTVDFIYPERELRFRFSRSFKKDRVYLSLLASVRGKKFIPLNMLEGMGIRQAVSLTIIETISRFLESEFLIMDEPLASASRNLLLKISSYLLKVIKKTKVLCIDHKKEAYAKVPSKVYSIYLNEDLNTRLNSVEYRSIEEETSGDMD